MIQIVKKSLIYTILLITLSGIALIADFLVFPSKYKGDVLFQVALLLDERNPSGSIDAIRYYQESIESYNIISYSEGLVRAYIHLGLLHFKFGNVLQVERMVLKALALGKDNIPLPLQAKSYLLLASTLTPERAIRYIDKALIISKELDLKPQIVRSYYLRGKLYEYRANFEQAEEQYLKAIQIINDFPSTVYYVDMVSLYERLGELYIGEGKINKAIHYYDAALAHNFRTNPKSINTANYMKILGDLYKENEEIAKACEFWRKSSEQYNFVSTLEPVTHGNFFVPDSCNNQLS